MTDALASVSGLISGLNWRDIIDQMMEIDRGRVSILEGRRDFYNGQLAEWKNINSKLLELQSVAQDLTAEKTYNLFSSSLASSSSTDPDDILTISTTNSAARGTYNIRVLQKAQAQKMGSAVFSTRDTALSLSGEFLVNGQAIAVSTTDTLEDIRDAVNLLNNGANATNVTATIISSASDEYQLILTSDDSGSTGFSLLDASTSNILQSLGFVNSTSAIKSRTSDGAKSDTYASSATAVGSLRGLSTIPGSTSVTIAGQAVNIDLQSESLTDIAANINALTGISASVVTETDSDSNTLYRIDISGTTSFSDSSNVLQILGILEGQQSSINEMHTSANAMTQTSAAGGGVVSDTTLWSEINTGSDANNVVLSDTMTITGKKNDGTAVSSTFTISNTSEALNATGGFLETIETAFGGASLVDAYFSDGSDGNTAGMLVVKDLTAGGSLLEVNIFAGNEGGGTLDFGELTETTAGRDMELVTGVDALVEVDGATFSRESNSITDLISGVSLNLVSAKTDTTVTLAIDRDVEEVKGKIQGFVDAYNSIITIISEQQSYDSENEETGGILFGDGTLRSVKSDLVTQVLASVTGITSSYTTLGLIGINLQDDGSLKIDNDELTDLLNNNFSDVLDLMAVRGEGSSSTIKFVSNGIDTIAGNYDLNITQAASKGATTGTTDLSGGISGDETVTITDTLTNRVATISLTSGDDIDEVVSKFNTEFQTDYAQQLTSSANNSLIAGGAITSSSLWNAIDTGGGTNDISNGAVINFTGTRRSGYDISGSYTITDTSTDTVQGLLSAVESAYNNEVYATIDTNGALIITERETGTSQLGFSISGITDGGSLDLGTTSTTVTGRYGIEMTASKNGSNQLVLSHNSYGSGYGFTLSQTANNLGMTDQTYNGTDVAGTINGEAATGSGQILTGSDGESNIDGLVLQYTGSSIGAVGSISLTLGIMENFYRTAYGLTDNFDGYVEFKMESLSDTVDRIDRNIERMEDTLGMKRQRLISQFLVMEETIAKLNAQGSWLTSQLGSG
ncbi:MAG: flagellar hook protein [Calditrichaeota bacterium]|nr:MAG: flagellar hook protein [Calditrichota bacterium]